jgi:GNAT superfamily N-acetyltransferase
VKLTRYDRATEFLRDNRATLEANEAANGLIVGIAERVREDPGVFRHGVYMAAIHEGADLVAAAVRTAPFRVIVYSALGADPEPLGLLVEDLLDFIAERPPNSPAGQVSGVVANSPTGLAFAEAWARRTGKAFKPGKSLRIYELREVAPPRDVPGQLRPARESDLPLVADWIYEFSVDAFLPADREEARSLAERRIDAGDVFIWEHEGKPVSIAGKGRRTTRGIAIGLVYTPRELRNRGYASACVAALSQQLLDAGWEFCTLYTDLANPTSNSIYQRIGYRPVCDSNEFDFETD